MTITFFSLPAEIIWEISSYINSRDVCALVRTSKQVALLVSQRLYDRALTEATRSRSIRHWRSDVVACYLRNKPKSFFHHTQGRNGQTLLHRTAKVNNPWLLNLLLTLGSGINAKDAKGRTALHIALRAGENEQAEKLLGAGADVLSHSDEDVSIFGPISGKISEHVISKLITAVKDAGRDISSREPSHTPLHYAALSGNIRLARALISHGANPLATNCTGHEPLVTAVLAKKVEVAGLLLNAMKPSAYNINAPVAPFPDGVSYEPWISDESQRWYSRGDTILHTGVRGFDPSVIRLLLDHGANPIAPNERTKRGRVDTPFSIAARCRGPEVLAAVVGTKYPPPCWTTEGDVQDGFETCVREAYPMAVRILLDLYQADKLNLDINTSDQSTGAHNVLGACQYWGDHRPDEDVSSTIKYMFEAGVDINIARPDGYTALHILCQDNDESYDAKIALAHYLLDAGADWRLCDKDNRTALFHAARNNFGSVVKRIISSLDPNDKILRAVDKEGDTVLHAALRSWPEYDCDMIKVLLDKGCDPNAVNKKGWSPAHEATALHDSFETIAGYLLNAGGSLSLKDNEGNPPLHWAVQSKASGKHKVIRVLIEAGADLHDGCEACDTVTKEFRS